MDLGRMLHNMEFPPEPEVNGLNELDIEYKLKELADFDSDEENYLEKSFIFQKPEANIRFKDKLTDRKKFKPRKQVEILDVDSLTNNRRRFST